MEHTNLILKSLKLLMNGVEASTLAYRGA